MQVSSPHPDGRTSPTCPTLREGETHRDRVNTARHPLIDPDLAAFRRRKAPDVRLIAAVRLHAVNPPAWLDTLDEAASGLP